MYSVQTCSSAFSANLALHLQNTRCRWQLQQHNETSMCRKEERCFISLIILGAQHRRLVNGCFSLRVFSYWHRFRQNSKRYVAVTSLVWVFKSLMTAFRKPMSLTARPVSLASVFGRHSVPVWRWSVPAVLTLVSAQCSVSKNVELPLSMDWSPTSPQRLKTCFKLRLQSVFYILYESMSRSLKRRE